MNHLIEDIKKAIHEVLSASNSSEWTALKNKNLLLSEVVLVEESSYKIYLESDRLNLEQKIFVEGSIYKSLFAKFAKKLFFSIYFQTSKVIADESFDADISMQKIKAAEKRKTKHSIDGVDKVIAVYSGKGGVGKSFVSMYLARALVREGYTVGILDADIYGPSTHHMLGLGQQLMVDKYNQLIPREAHGIKCISFASLLSEDQVVQWRGPLVSKAITQFCKHVTWGSLDYLVIDMPPGTGDIPLTLFDTIRIDGSLLVTTSQELALLDAYKSYSLLSQVLVPVLGIVENLSNYICSSCGQESSLFGNSRMKDFSDKCQSEILIRVPVMQIYSDKICTNEGNLLLHSLFRVLVKKVVTRMMVANNFVEKQKIL